MAVRTATDRGLELLLCRPNPTAGASHLESPLPESGIVRIEVLDPGGRSVRSRVDGLLPAGRHAIDWLARNDSGDPVANGLYYVRLSSGRQSVRRATIVVHWAGFV